MSRRAFIRGSVLFLFVAVMVFIPHMKTWAIPAQINKSFSPTIIDPGGVSTMRIELFNPNTGYDLTNSTFTDNLPSGMFVAVVPNITNACGGSVTALPGSTSVSLSGGTVPRQVGNTAGSCVFTVDVTSTQQGNLINTILANALTNDQLQTNSTPASATLTVRTMAALSVNKLMTPNTFYTGATSRLEIRISNNDNAIALTGVNLTDTFPLPLTIATPANLDASDAACGGPTVTATPGTGALQIAGASIPPNSTCNIFVDVTQTTIGAYTNEIFAGDLTSNQGITNQYAYIDYSVQANILNISKTFTPSRLNSGAVSQLRIRLQNPTTVPATAVAVTDNMPSEVVVAATPNVQFNTANCGSPTVTATAGSSSIVINGGLVPPNTTCDIFVDVTSTTYGVFVNSIPPGNVSAGNGFSASGTANASITFNGLTLAKTFTPDVIESGGISHLRIAFNNLLPVNLVGINLADSFPSEIKIANPSNVTSTCTGGTLTATPGNSSIAITNTTVPTSGCYIEVDVKVTLPGSSYLDRTNNIGADTVTIGTVNPVIVPHPSTGDTLRIVPIGGGGTGAPIASKSFNPSTVQVGQVSQLRINVFAPDGNLSSLAFSDSLPAGLTIASPNGVVNTCNGTVTAVPTTSVISLTGGTVTSNNNCHVWVNVVAVNAPGSYTNSMLAGSVTALVAGNPVPVANANAFSASLTVNTNISVNKSFTPSTIQAADGSSALLLQITAPATSALSNVTFSDPLPAGMIADPASLVTSGCGATPLVTANSVSLSNGTIAAGATCQIQVTVTAPLGSGPLTNTLTPGTVTGTFGNGAPGSNSNTVSATLTVEGLTVSKQFQPSTISADGRSTLIITIRNFTATELTNLSLTDNLPTSGTRWLMVANPPLAATTCGTGLVNPAAGDTTISLTGGQILPWVNGVEGICTINVDVVPQNHTGPYTSGFATNTINAGQVTNDQGVTNPDAASANLNFTPLILNVNKKFDPLSVGAGQYSTLTVEVANPQGTAIVDAAFTDSMPTGMVVFGPPALTVTNCGSDYTHTGITVGSAVFSFDGLDIAANTTCTIALRVTSTASGNLTNTIPAGGVTSKSGASNQQAASASLTYLPGISLLKTFTPDAIDAGTVSRVTIQINNTNSFEIVSVSLTDALPAGLTVAGTPDAQTTCTGGTVTAVAGSTSIALAGATIPANATCTFSANVTANEGGTYVNDIPANTLTAQDAGGETFTNAEPTEATLEVTPIVDVRIEKTGPAIAGVGDTLVYTLLVTNDGPSSADGTVFNDDVPAEITVSGATCGTPTGGAVCGTVSQVGNAVSSTITTLPPNSSVTFTITGTPNTQANVINTATVTPPVTDSNPQNNTDSFPSQLENRYSLGNFVWYDTNNDGLWASGEIGIDGVQVDLYAADAGGNPTGASLATATTAGGGYYRFDLLEAGDYVVVIPATQLASGGPLEGYYSSLTSRDGSGALVESAAPDPDNDVDSDDNGTLQTSGAFSGAVISGAVTLGPGDVEPGGDAESGPGDPGTVDLRSNLTVDFGFYTMTLGNLVWHDVNDNGAVDALEPLLDGVAVELYAADSAGNPVGAALATATTGPNGEYTFINLAAGDYIVRLPASNFTGTGPLMLYTSSAGAGSAYEPAPDPDDNVDNDDNGTISGVLGQSGYIQAAPVTLSGGAEPDVSLATGTTSNLTVDFGVVALYHLGNRVWFDTNNNGVRDAGEVGIDGVTVELYAADAGGSPTGIALDSTFTTGGGYYNFTELRAGDYVVVIPANQFASGAPLYTTFSSLTQRDGTGALAETAAPDPDNDAPNDDNGTLQTSGTFSGAVISGAVTLGPLDSEPTTETDLGAGDPTEPQPRSNLTVDFGFYTIVLGDQVWDDLNNNGLLDGETGLDGVTVDLYAADSGGNPVGGALASTATAGGGFYQFAGLAAGDYIVRLAAANFDAGGALEHYTSSTGLPGSPYEPAPDPDGNIDSDDNGTISGVLGSGGTIQSAPITLSGSAEPGVDNATGTTTNLTLDFGVFVPFSLGNQVWFDRDNSGQINGGEVGIPNVAVDLLDSTGTTTLATAVTDSQGHYRFDNLPAGNYLIEIPASNFTAGNPLNMLVNSTGPGQEANPNSDGDNNDNGLDVALGNPVRTAIVTLGPGDNEPINETYLGTGDPGAQNVRSNLSVDLGFTPVYSLGNRVWFDGDNSGVLEAGEIGIDGVVVNLLNGTGSAVLATTTTANGGYYRFDELVTANYIVQIAASNFQSGGALVGTLSSTGIGQELNPNANDDNNDNGLDTLVAGAIRSGIVSIGPGDVEPVGETDFGPGDPGAQNNRSNLSVDFGFYQTETYSLGNRVWLDTDGNGLRNGVELGVGGVTINLLDGSGTAVLLSAVSDGDGYYRFDNLPAGNYIVQIAASNFQAAGPLVGTSSSTGAGQEANPNANGDDNDNGLDAPVAGAIRSGVVTLGPGGVEPVGETDLGPGDAALVDDHTNLTVDFGFIATPVYSLGNRVWFDADNDGLRGGAELGVPNAVVNLLDGVGALLTSTTTDADGYYRFDNLSAGNYIVEIAASNFQAAGPLVGYSSSTGAGQEASPNTNGDDNDNGLDVPVAGAVRSAMVALGPGDVEPVGEGDLGPGDPGAVDARSNLTVDFGFITAPLFSLGNRVWFDANNDGLRGGSELGVLGATVNLLDGTGAPLASTTTDADGYYRFDDLPAGDYIVEIAASNFQGAGPLVGTGSSTGAGQEANPNGNGDDNDNGLDVPVAGATRSAVVTLGPGDVEPVGESDLGPGDTVTADARSNLTVDFGFIAISTYSLGNRVWFDLNADGLRDAGEPPVPGAVVELLDGAGGVIISTTTDADGYYRFDDLAAGDYIVSMAASNFQGANVLAGYGSTTGAGQEANPNLDGDDNDNGLDNLVPASNGIRSGVVTLGPGDVEPVGESDLGPGDAATVDARSNLTVDFGFVAVETYSLGNRVWLDSNNDGLQLLPEQGIADVRVNLLDATGTHVLLTAITDQNGYYRFDNLLPGDYIVQIDKTNFQPGGTLENRVSSTGGGEEANPNSDGDTNDNGINGLAPAYVGVQSGVATLGPGGSEPTGESDLGPGDAGTADDHSNLTVDFGFIPVLNYSVGNRVWFDTNGSGDQTNDEPGVPDVTLQLLDGATGDVLGETTTDASGYYRFDNLLEGTHIVAVAASNFGQGAPLYGYSSSGGSAQEANPDNNLDRNDNGLDTPVGGAIRSGIVTLGPDGAEPLNEADLAPSGQGSADGRANMTVDFGFINTPGTSYYTDPFINKLGDPSLVVPGEQVTFTLTVGNNGNLPATGVIVVDPLPNSFILESAATPQGTYVINGNTVTFYVGTIQPGQIIDLTVFATVAAHVNAGAGLTLVNEAVLTYAENPSAVLTADATLDLITSLPQTGYTPDEPTHDPARTAVVAAAISLVVLGLVGLLVLRRRR